MTGIGIQERRGEFQQTNLLGPARGSVDLFGGSEGGTNTELYLAGGRPMPDYPGAKSRNITPGPTFGLPGGLTLHEFTNVMRHGQDQQKPGRILQGMPWPVYWKED